MLEPNSLLHDRYLIVQRIGQGGMGAVYQAVDQRLGNTVALKETLVEGDQLRAAFEREARMLASLRHNSLPRVSDHFTEGDGQFLVMEFIPGQDVAALLQANHGPFPQEQVLRWGDQLLDALDYLHSQNPPIVHRDIKPQNLKLTDRGEIILLDFGLAKGGELQMSRVTSGGSIFGYTPQYAPLEQIQGIGTDSRSDLYSLAATLYHLLTGTEPPDALARASARIHEAPDPLRPANTVNSRVHPGVAAVLMRAMAQQPDQRYARASEMRAAMREAFRAPMPAATPPAPSPQVPGGSKPAPMGQAARVTPAPTPQPGAASKPDAAARKPALPGWLLPAVGGGLLLLLLTCGAFYLLSTRNPGGATPEPTAEVAVVNATGTEAANAVERSTEPVELEQTALVRTGGQVLSLAYSPDGSVLAAGHMDRVIRLYDASSGAELRRLEGHTDEVTSVAFNAESDLLASGSLDNTVRIWQVSSGTLIRTLSGHAGGVLSVAFSADGTVLASGGIDDAVILWNTQSGQRLQTLDNHSAAVNAVAFSPNGELMASGGVDDTIILWRAGTGEVIRTLTGHTDEILDLAFSPDSTLLASSGGLRDPVIRLWRSSDGTPVRTLSGHGERVPSIDFSPDNQFLISGSYDRTARLWSVFDGSHLGTMTGHTEEVRAVSFARDGEGLATGSEDNTIRLWSMP